MRKLAQSYDPVGLSADGGRLEMVAAELGGEERALNLVKDLADSEKWNPRSLRRSRGVLPPIWGVGEDGIALSYSGRKEGDNADVDFESSKYAGELAHCLFVFLVASYGVGVGKIEMMPPPGGANAGEGDEDEHDGQDEVAEKVAWFDTTDINLVIRERLEFREGDSELTRVDLQKVENVALQMRGEGDAVFDICYTGENAEEIVTKVERALGERGISMGRLRRRPSPSRIRGNNATTISFKTVQTIHLDGAIEFSACSSSLDLYSDADTPASSTSRILGQVARMLERHPFHHVVCEGHTDDRPSPFGTNLELSMERAEAVKIYLVGRGGVEASRIKAAGFGEKVRSSQ